MHGAPHQSQSELSWSLVVLVAVAVGVSYIPLYVFSWMIVGNGTHDAYAESDIETVTLTVTPNEIREHNWTSYTVRFVS